MVLIFSAASRRRSARILALCESVWQDDHKLFTTIARNHIHISCHLAQQISEFDQAGITRSMSIVIIHLFEKIDIKKTSEISDVYIA